MAGKRLNTEIRREQIAAAALEVIGTHGVRGLNVARVAKRVGLVPSGIYRHFKGKREVLEAVVDLIGARLRANVAAVRAERSDPLERLELLLARHVQLIRQVPAIPRVVLSGELAAADRRLKQKLRRTIQAYLRAVAAIVRAGQEAGRIRSDVPAQTVALLFVGLIQPGVFLATLGGGRFDLAGHADRAWRLFRDALSAERHSGRS